MVVKLSYEQLSALRRIDSPTISNAIETFKVRPRVAGYVGYDIRFLGVTRGLQPARFLIQTR
jgi:4-hydroxy-4-methyl-2-oxoglutarate aldolase